MPWGAHRPGFAFFAGAPLLIAHRGGAGLAPENTLAALRSGIGRWRADVVEFDLRMTGDGVPVAFHDPTVERTTDGTGALADMPWTEVSALDAGYRFRAPDGSPSFRGRGVAVPRYEDILEEFPAQRFIVELKQPEVALPFLEITRRHAAEGRVVLATIREVNRAAIRSRYRGPLSGSRTDVSWFSLFTRTRLARWMDPRVDAFQVPEFSRGVRVLTSTFIRAAQRANAPVHVWTVNEVAEMHRILDLGVDGILTDRPDRLARVLHERSGRPLPPHADPTDDLPHSDSADAPPHSDATDPTPRPAGSP